MLKESLVILVMMTIFTSCSTLDGNESLPTPIPTAEFPFDGIWTGELFTLTGTCRKTYTFNRLTVRDGLISGNLHGNRGKYELTGAVKIGGTAEMILQGGDTVELSGTFDSTNAEGRWGSVAGCDGTFLFKRKGI